MFDVWLPVKWHWRTVHFRLEESNAFSPDRSEEDVLDLYHSVALMAVVVAVATVPVCFISSLSRSKWLVARLFVLVVKYQLLGLFAFYMERGRERERETYKDYLTEFESVYAKYVEKPQFCQLGIFAERRIECSIRRFETVLGTGDCCTSKGGRS